MNREIKFRAWDGIRITTSGIMFNNSTGCIDVPTGTILMQYTGLKDRNGKEIYEGDILGRRGNRNNLFVCFDAGRFMAKHEDDVAEWREDLRIVTRHSEVIGNIYENPNLIKP